MSGAKPDIWMPLYIGDYLADTMHLSTSQHGAYFLLIMAYWRKGSALADDDGILASTTRASLAEWKRLRPVLSHFFMVDEGAWTHKRIEAELAAWRTRKETFRAKASNASRKRWGMLEGLPQGMLGASAKHGPSNGSDNA